MSTVCVCVCTGHRRCLKAVWFLKAFKTVFKVSVFLPNAHFVVDFTLERPIPPSFFSL